MGNFNYEKQGIIESRKTFHSALLWLITGLFGHPCDTFKAFKAFKAFKTFKSHSESH